MKDKNSAAIATVYIPQHTWMGHKYCLGIVHVTVVPMLNMNDVQKNFESFFADYAQCVYVFPKRFDSQVKLKRQFIYTLYKQTMICQTVNYFFIHVYYPVIYIFPDTTVVA